MLGHVFSFWPHGHVILRFSNHGEEFGVYLVCRAALHYHLVLG